MTHRRRTQHTSTPYAEWLVEREERMARAASTRLGMRPAGWWEFESDRPDLAKSAGSDAYCHLTLLTDPEPFADLDYPMMKRAAERLRYLATHNELTPAERHAIATEPGYKFAWRRTVLAQLEDGEPFDAA